MTGAVPFLGGPGTGGNYFPTLNYPFSSNLNLVDTSSGLTLTFTRASVQSYFDSAGSLQSAATDVAAFDYNPTTLASLGLSLWEARTNSLRNNSMTGAVAGTARTIGTISGISRSASTTIVVASTGHTVSVNDTITVSGADVAEYNGTFIVSAVTANVSYSYVSASSQTDSATGYTVSAVSPGTNPTSWVVSPASGIARTIVGTGTENGINYVDIRFAGLVTSAAIQNVAVFESTTQVVAAQNDLWTTSVYLKLVGGSMANISALNLNTVGRDVSGVFLEQALLSILGVTSAALNTQRYTVTDTLTNASTARVTGAVALTPTISTMIDFTIRYGMPQLELGAFATPVIATTAAAATRAAPTVETTDLSWYNTSAGTFVCKATIGQASATGFAYQINAGATDRFGLNTTSTTVAFGGVDAGVTQWSNLGAITYTVNTLWKHAGAYKANDIAASGNGAAAGTDVSATIPGITRLSIGARNNGLSPLSGWVDSLTYYPSRLPNAILVSLST